MGVLALQWPVRLPVARPDAISRGIGREIIARFMPAGACGIASVGTGRVACSEGSASSSPGRRAFSLLSAPVLYAEPADSPFGDPAPGRGALPARDCP